MKNDCRASENERELMNEMRPIFAGYRGGDEETEEEEEEEEEEERQGENEEEEEEEPVRTVRT